MLSSSTLSCSRAFGCEPYPIGTTYLHTVALRANETDDGRFPAARRKQTSRKSVSRIGKTFIDRSEEHTSELQSRGHLVCRLLLEKKKKKNKDTKKLKKNRNQSHNVDS